MKIYFVGINNKKGFCPLDSKTKTGKVIDLIISKLKCETIKTNLCDCNFLPDLKDIRKYALEWHEKNSPKENDIIILLGKFVEKNFIKYNGLMILEKHPSYIFGNKNIITYVDQVLIDISNIINECGFNNNNIIK